MDEYIAHTLSLTSSFPGIQKRSSALVMDREVNEGDREGWDISPRIRIMGQTSKESVALEEKREDSHNSRMFMLGSVAMLL